jgi:hypothetical protein
MLVTQMTIDGCLVALMVVDGALTNLYVVWKQVEGVLTQSICSIQLPHIYLAVEYKEAGEVYVV